MELSSIACHYLKSCKIVFDHSFVKNRIKSHPNYPSLLSFTETLDELSIEYSAVKLENSDLVNANFPILVHINEKDSNNFYIIKSPSKIQKIEKTKGGVWRGIACIVQNRSIIKSIEHKDLMSKKNAKKKATILLAAIAFITYILIAILSFNLLVFIISFLCIVGCFVCYTIFIQSIGRDNFLSKKLCGLNSSVSCNKVFSSKLATIFPYITLGDIGIIYFSTLFIILIWSTIFGLEVSGLRLLQIPAFFSLLFSCYSIWYQGRIVKDWCKMCLTVIGILWIQGIIILFDTFSDLSASFNNLSLQIILGLVFSLLISSTWMLIKNGITKENLLDSAKIKLLKWQRNPNIFLFLSKKQRAIENKIAENEIVLGNIDAPYRFIVACSPYCGPCSKQHKEMEELLNIYPEKVCIIIRFVLNLRDQTDLKFVTVEEILRKYHAYSSAKQDQLKLLEDWYATMDLDTWRKKWEATSDIKLDETLKHLSDWTSDTNITYTPTTFLNGFKVPDEYEFKDFNYLLNTLDEIISQKAIRSVIAL